MNRFFRKVGIKTFTVNETIAFSFIAFLLIALAFVYSSKIMDAVLMPRFFLLSSLVLLLSAFYIFSLYRKKQFYELNILKDPFFLFFLVFIVFNALSAINSINISETVFEFLKIIPFFSFLVLFVILLKKSENIEIILSSLVLLFSIIILIFGIIDLFDVLKNSELNHQTSYLIKGYFAHRNLYSQVLFLCLPFLFYCIYKYKSYKKILPILLSIIIIGFICILLTRSVWIALIISALFSFVFLIIFRKKFFRKDSKILALF